MRLPEAQIKQAILHPELPVSTLALHYFSRSFSEDPTVMPLVIEAVEKFGREASLHLIGEAENLRQTETTIQWCLEELRRDFGEQDDNLNDYRYAVSRVLTHADPSLTLGQESAMLELPFFSPELRTAFSERIRLINENPETVWNNLLDFCERENDKEYLSEMDLPHAYRLVEALGREGAGVADRVLSMLDEKIDYCVNSPRTLMQGFVLRLAGELRLKAAIPSLVQLLKEDDDWFNEECQRALSRIGGDEVVEALSKEFPTAEWHFRLFASGVLEQVHTELAVQKCIELFEQDRDPTIKSYLGQAALSQFAAEAIEPVRQFILANRLDPEILDMRENLVAASTVLGVDFPEYEQWKQDDEESRALRRKLFAEKYGGFQEPSADWLDDTEDDFYGSEHDEVVEPIPAPTTFVRQDRRIGRNDPCPCGSGKKYKKCCMNKSNGNPLLN